MKHIRVVLFLLFGLFSATPSFADWLALAVDDGGSWGISVRDASKRQAESAALKQCRKVKSAKKCKVIWSSDQLGYVAVAVSKTSLRATVRDTLDVAKRSALDDCAKDTATDDTCMIEWTGINGVVQEPHRIAQTNTSDCRPQTRELRCRSNCVNGNCVVEYENGCKIRVQVSPRFDSFSNQWTYPSPSC